MKVNLTKKLVEDQYPDIFKDLKFKGDLDNANVYLDIAVAINNKHIGRDEFSSEKEYWLENYKNGVVFISLVVSEGKKKTLIEAKKLTNLFVQYGLPAEFIKDEPEKKYATNITFKVPKWSSDYICPYLEEHLVLGVFNNDYIITKSSMGVEAYKLENNILKYDDFSCGLFFDDDVVSVSDVKINKKKYLVSSSEEDIKKKVTKEVVVFDNTTEEIKTNFLIKELQGMAGFSSFGTKPKVQLEVFNLDKFKDAIIVPYNQSINAVFRKNNKKKIVNDGGVMNGADFMNMLVDKSNNIAESDKIKKDFLIQEVTRKFKL